jgi:germination protein YpeB
MQENYYEIAEGLVTFNFAYMQDGTTCYTDLIKVGVALDDNAVLFFDARGFIFNHTTRPALTASITREQAAQSVSSALSIRSSKLALIPTSGKNEVLTYEFLCDGKEGEELLVYINAATGAEEQLLILMIGENGALTA